MFTVKWSACQTSGFPLRLSAAPTLQPIRSFAWLIGPGVSEPLRSHFMVQPTSPIRNFEISGVDRNFVPATAAIVGNTIEVSATSVSNRCPACVGHECRCGLIQRRWIHIVNLPHRPLGMLSAAHRGLSHRPRRGPVPSLGPTRTTAYFLLE